MTVLIQRGIEIVPGYTLIRRVGSGMAGEVWVARASGGVHVAIKIIRDMEMVGSKRELGALRIVREVKHTNLCPLIGVWFFDRDGELLSNSETDEILGRESSLIDTAFVSRKDGKEEGLRETPSMGLDGNSSLNLDFDSGDKDSGSKSNQSDPVIGSDRLFAETSELSGIESMFGDQPQHASESSRESRDETDSRADENPLGEASQMVVAMGLGDRTLFDRLVEMRAPGNMPAEDDPMHLPGGIPVKELLQYISGSASAIDELNLNHNIYHCDIKPQNILVVGGNAQVCDFGLARRVQENRRTQMAFGTPAYGAPEMLFDQTYTKTIDQYSLAITYYELRTGKLPFETTRRSTFLRSKAQGELHLTDVTSAEQEVIAKATDLDPELRYPSCMAFVDALTEAVYAKPKVDRRNAKRAVAAATILAALAIPTALHFTRPETTASIESPKETPVIPEEEEVPEIGELPSIEVADPKSTDFDPAGEPTNASNEMVAKSDIESEVQPKKVPRAEEVLPADVPKPVTTEMASPKNESTPKIEPELKPEPEPTLEDFITQATLLAQELIESEANPTEDEISVSPDLVTRQRELMGELEQEFGKTQQTGWELVDPNVRSFAITVAGQIHWNNDRVSEALQNWISIKENPNLREVVPADWRYSVAEQTVDWLIQNAKVSDQETTRHRYSELTKQANIVFPLASRFASDSETQSRRVDSERFLLAAAEGDTLNGLKLWGSLELSKSECSPQLGYALASLASSRLTQATQSDERKELINLRLLGSNLQYDDSTDTGDIDEANRRWKDRQDCFELLDEIVQPKLDQLPVLSAGVETAELATLAEDYVAQACKRLSSADHAEFLVQLRNIELAASIASMHSKSPEVCESMRLTSTEAFFQLRYEQADDIPAAKLVGRLRAYGGLVDSDGPMDRLVLARVQDQNGLLSRDVDKIRLAYDESRSLYTSLIDDLAASPDVRGSAARCRASLLTRIAAIADPEEKADLLKQANADAQLAITLPQRWHLDTDDRLMTAAEANLAMVRLLDKLPASEKQSLLDDTDQYLGQAIAERDKRSFPFFQHAVLRLNGYLLDLLNSTDEKRRLQREVLAKEWMAKVAKVPLPVANRQAKQLPDRTVDSPSSRLRCHWHSMCSMVLSELKEPEKAMTEIEYARQIALEKLEPYDDRGHLATLIMFQLKCPPLVQSIEKGQRPDRGLINDLERLLETIVEPTPAFNAKKKQYLEALDKM